MEGRISRLGLASQVQLGVQQQLVNQMYRFGPAGAIAANSLGLVGGGMAAVSAGTIAATAGIVAVAGAAFTLTRRGIPQVQEFQRSLRVMVAGGEDLDAAGLDETLRRIQEQAGAAGRQFSRSQIATAMSELVKAGLDARSAMDLLVPGMRLAAVTGEDLNTTTSRLLANLRQFRLGTTEAARVADVLAVADLNAAETAAELSEGLRIVGPVAQAAGVALEDVTGILVELNNAGLPAADMAATALRSTLAQLLAPSGAAQAALDRLGVKLRDVNGEARPLLDVLRDLRAAMEESGEAAQAAAEIFDTRAITAILNYSEKSDALAASLRNANGAAKEYADTFLDNNLIAAQNELNAALDDLAATFTTAFADDIAKVANAISNVVRYLDELANAPSIDLAVKIAIRPIIEGIEEEGLARFLLDWLLDSMPLMPPQAKEAARRAFEELFVPKPLMSGGRRTAGTAIPGPVGPVINFGGDNSIFGPPLPGEEEGLVAVGASLDDLIAKARQLKAALEAARDPRAWIAANQAVEAFRASSDDAAIAWEAVNATTREVSATKPPRTWQDVFTDLAESGKLAEQRALAFGNTTEAQLESVQTRARLVEAAIKELTESFGFTFASDEVQFLIARLEALGVEEERLKRLISQPATRQDVIAGLTAPGTVHDALAAPGGVRVDPDAEKARLQQLADADARVKGELSRSEQEYVRQSLRNLGLLEASTVEYVGIADRAAGANTKVARALVDMAPATQRAALEQQKLLPALREQEAALVTLLGVYQVGSDKWLEAAATLAQVRGEIDELTDRSDALQANLRALAQARADAFNARAGVRALRRDANDIIEQAVRDFTLTGSTTGIPALKDLEQQIVDALNEAGDDPSAAPLAGLLTKVRAVLSIMEADAEDTANRIARTLTSNAGLQAAQNARVEQREFARRIAEAVEEGSVDTLKSVEADLVRRLQELGDDPSAAPLLGLLVRVRREISDAAVRAERLDVAKGKVVEFTRAQVALGQATRQDVIAALRDQITTIEELLPTVEDGSQEQLDLAAALVEARTELGEMTGATDRGRVVFNDFTAASIVAADGMRGVASGARDLREQSESAAETVDLLRARLQHAILVYGANSEEVARLSRELNELQLRLALEDLRANGFAGLSEASKAVLRLNGVMLLGEGTTRDFATALRDLAGATGNEIAAGIADIIDGIQQIATAAGDASDIVAGLTLAFNGATRIGKAAQSGDTFGAVSGFISAAAEGIGQLKDIPGLGALATAALGFGQLIIQGISDAFTGDSPAARAIRDNLTPAVASAFANGIMAALKGQEDWREALKGNVKEAFLGALIQAFVQGAIVEAILAPLILQFSKLIGQKRYEEAKQFLAAELPAAVEEALQAVDIFVGSIPSGLLPGSGDARERGGDGRSELTPSIHSLPVASVVAAPSWVPELGANITRFGTATETFDSAVTRLVENLVEAGVTVNVNQTRFNGSAAAARAA
ncbi:MAG TPA: phage tail tape measure protein [Trueperaceae bacterium]